ncbi:MAG: isocitrate/isopropylmalate dehydrogenase family protein [Candidatus Methanoplasma sp.]|jgi:isocitrate dehydrogenase (NAD+)|nr:isocitrate/isopropylmalate dehydrogenase family protein [Candidatus Methanoplasma sp.]
MVDENSIKVAQERYGELLRQQLKRVENLKKEGDWTDYSKLDKLIIGVCGGDGIGPYICASAQKVMEFLLADKIKAGKAEVRAIEGLTIERRSAVMKAIPDDTLEELKKCHVILKGPTTTPSKGDPWPNIESANVAMRKQLDLFANMRPVSVPELGIDWTFFRENTEGSYALGSDGIDVTEDLAMDFCVATTQGTDRIVRAGFEFAKKSGLNYLSLVTKANIVKTTDGKFLSTVERIGKEYPGVKWDSWFIDIMTAKLIDPARRSDFKVFVLPNLYGDILTDEAAQIQGGVGTAGSANIGKRYAMFEAIHGSAPRMVDEGRAQYADPCSMIKAVALMMNHIGETEKGKKLNMALDVCVQFERKLVMTGRSTGATGDEFAQYVMETIQRPDLEKVWNGYLERSKTSAKGA